MYDQAEGGGLLCLLRENSLGLFQGEPQLRPWPPSGSDWLVNPQLVPLRRDLLQALPGPLLRLHRALPLDLHENTLILGMEDPQGQSIQELIRRLTGWDVLAVQLCPEGGPLPAWSELTKRPLCRPEISGFRLDSSQLTARIVGDLAWVSLRQSFTHLGEESTQANYQLALPDSAILQQWEACLSGQSLAHPTPRRTFSEGRSRLSLLVGRVAPHQRVDLALSYVQLMERDSEGMRIALPAPPGPAPFEANLLFQSEGLEPEHLRCSRPARWKRLDRDSLQVVLGPESGARDLVCHCRISESRIGADLYSDGQHFLLQLQASGPSVVNQEPKDVVFLLDRSASLEGWLSEQGRRALLQALKRLRPLDRFSMALFDHQVVAWQEGRWVESGALCAAREWLQYQGQGSGSTDLVQALVWLREHLRRNPRQRPIYGVLVSDGQCGHQAEAGRVATSLIPLCRLFALGIGPRCDSQLLSRLTELAGGSLETAPSSEKLPAAVERLCLQLGPPALSQIRLVGQGFHPDLTQIHPHKLPDLFAGQTLTVTGKHQGTGPLQISSLSPEGPVCLTVSPVRSDHPAPSAFWAQRQLQSLHAGLSFETPCERQQSIQRFQQLQSQYIFDPSLIRQMVKPASGSTQSYSGLTLSLLEEAVRRQATHIHVESGQPGQIRLRVCGRLLQLQNSPLWAEPGLTLAVVQQIRQWCQPETTPGPFQHGRFQQMCLGLMHEFDTSFCPAVGGEKVVLEIRSPLPRTHPRLAEPGLNALEGLLRRKRGLILICGPRGSGATSLIVDWLRQLSAPQRTALFHKEEWFGLTSVAQFTDPKLSRLIPQITGAQNLDVLGVSSTRDKSLWEALLQRAREDCLVLARHPAPQATSALADLVSSGLPGRRLAQVLLGAISLRRVPRLCECKRAELDANILSAFRDDGDYSAPVGCDRCHGSGFEGELLCHELLIPKTELAATLIPGVSPQQIEKACIRHPMEQQLQLLARRGWIAAQSLFSL